jgi:hypothetical protein
MSLSEWMDGRFANTPFALRDVACIATAVREGFECILQPYALSCSQFSKVPKT